MPITKINAQNIYYEIHGDKRDVPLVLIPGLGCDHTLWTNILDTLLSTQQVILFDNRGSGQSSEPDHPYTINDMANDLHGLLEFLNYKKINLIGHSMGGMIAQEFALNFPNKLHKLVLYSSLANMDLRTQKLLLNTAKFFELGYVEEAFNTILINSLGNRILANSALVQQALDAMKNNPYPQSIEAFWGQFNACIEHDTRSRLQKINVPTLVLGGIRDIIALRNDTEEIAAQIPAASLVTIPDVAHQAHVENPAVFLQAINAFLI